MRERTIMHGDIRRLHSEINELNYTCDFVAPQGEWLWVNVHLPEGLVVDLSMFSKFEKLLLSYNTISELETVLREIKSIEIRNGAFKKFPRIELCASKNVQDVPVPYLEILERDGKMLQYVSPIYGGEIMLVKSTKAWECYDEEYTFHVICQDGSEPEIECLNDADKCKVSSRIPLFRRSAEKIYEQIFSN